MNAIIEKARKLLALRDRAGTQGEAEAAAKALAGMLEKYRIEIAQLESDEEHRKPFIADKDEPLVVWRRAVAWRRSLVDTLCKHYGVVTWKQKRICGRSRNGRRMYQTSTHLCGQREDMSMVRYMFAWLTSEIVRIGKMECSGKGIRFSNSWMLGFVGGIAKQLADAREEVAIDEQVALTLRTRLNDARDALYEQIKGLSTTSYYERWNAAAYGQGQERGKAHHLGASLDAGNCRALPEAM